MLLKRITAAILSLIIMVATASLVGCVKENGGEGSDSVAPDPAESEPTANGGEKIAVIKGGDVIYKTVVFSAVGSFEEQEAAMTVQKALGNFTTRVELKKDDTYRAEAYEIVVATVSAYPEVAPLAEGLKYSDYVITKVGNKIVIVAATDDGINAAATKFVKMLTASEEKEVIDLSISETIYEAKYRTSEFTINGNDIKDYTIVYEGSEDKKLLAANLEVADKWRTLIGEATGAILPIVDDSVASIDREILLGNTNRAESAANAAEPLYYKVGVTGNKLVVNCGGTYSGGRLVDIFKSEVIGRAASVKLTEDTRLEGNLLTQPVLARAEGTDARIMSANILVEFPGWTSTKGETPILPRMEIFLANLYAYSPDVVIAVEVSPNWAKYLKENLGNGYKLILDTKADGSGNWSLLIYNSNAVELLDSGVADYTVRDDARMRNMGWGIFKLRSTNKEFAVISTHWNLKAGETVVQPNELIAKMRELSAGDTRPVISGGDLNCSDRWSETMYGVIANSDYVNNLKKITDEGAIHNGDIGTVKAVGTASTADNLTADYLFATKDVESLMFMTVIENATIDMSDHNAVMSDISF